MALNVEALIWGALKEKEVKYPILLPEKFFSAHSWQQKIMEIMEIAVYSGIKQELYWCKENRVFPNFYFYLKACKVHDCKLYNKNT